MGVAIYITYKSIDTLRKWTEIFSHIYVETLKW